MESPRLPACFSHAVREGLPPTMPGTSTFLTLALYLCLGQLCTPGSVLSHARAGQGSSKNSLVSKSLRLPELWWAEHQCAPRAKLPNAPAGAAIRRGGTAPHASTNVAVNTLKSSEQFPSHSVGRTEAGHTASPWPNFPCSTASLFYL